MFREDLERFNDWWFTGKVRSELAPPFRRYAFSRIVEDLNERQILLVLGSRRVGKTTLLYQTIEKLLETVPPAQILYFSFEDSTTSPKEVLDYYEKTILRKPFEDAGKAYVFFDEIQTVENWPAVIKQFYDLYPNLKFFVSGSSSLLLSMEALEKLAGRFFLLKVKPLMFREFLGLLGKGDAGTEKSARMMEVYFNDYLRKSGFPEIVSWNSETRIAEYIKNSVVDRVIFRDIPQVFKTRDMALMEKVTKFILSSPGSILNVNSLSQMWRQSKITVSNYLKFLETSLLVRSLSNYRPSFSSSSRKLKKYYPATPSLVFSQSKETFISKMGAVLETYVVNALDAEYYFREGKKEIDIILKDGKILPVEVKETIDENDISRLSKLLTLVKASRGILVTSSQEGSHGNVQIVPAYAIESLLEIENGPFDYAK